jgi:hypothetical protein
MMRNVLAAATLAMALTVAHSQKAPGIAIDRTALITRQAFDVKIVANGIDVTEKSPIKSVKYNSDGTGSRTLRDGSVVTGRWHFINPEQTQVEVVGPEGTSRWVIVELNEHIYRKVNMDTGVEFIHLPKL